MKALFGALESVDEYGKSTDELELEYNEALFEYEEVAAELDEMFEEENELVTAVEQLEQLTTIIEKHGLSKGMVATINILEPELSEHGVFPSVETLNDVPTKDSSSEVAVESIKSIATKAWDAIKKFFIMIYDGIIKAIGWVLRLFSSTKKIIDKYIILFRNDKLTFDDEKLKKTEIMYFKVSKVYPGDALKAYDEFLKTGPATIKSLTDVLSNTVRDSSFNITAVLESKVKPIFDSIGGMIDNDQIFTKAKVEVDKDKIKVEYDNDTPISKLEKTKLEDTDEAVDALDVLVDLKKLCELMDKSTKMKSDYKSFMAAVKIANKEMDKKDEAGKKALVASTKAIQSGFKAITKYNTKLNSAMAKFTKIRLKACIAVYGCRQK